MELLKEEKRKPLNFKVLITVIFILAIISVTSCMMQGPSESDLVGRAQKVVRYDLRWHPEEAKFHDEIVLTKDEVEQLHEREMDDRLSHSVYGRVSAFNESGAQQELDYFVDFDEKGEPFNFAIGD